MQEIKELSVKNHWYFGCSYPVFPLDFVVFAAGNPPPPLLLRILTITTMRPTQTRARSTAATDAPLDAFAVGADDDADPLDTKHT